MIDYSRIKDPIYFKETLSDISQVTDINVLSNLLKILSIKIANKEIDPDAAGILLGAIKDRNKTLTDIHRQFRNNNRYRRDNEDNGSGGRSTEMNGRQLTLSPTSVSNRVGAASIVLILLNITITTVMYTLLLIARIIK